MVYRAREVRTGRRVILKAYDSHTLSNSTRKQALERHVLTLRAAQATIGPNGGLVALERVVENSDGTFLVVQACNGEGCIPAVLQQGSGSSSQQQHSAWSGCIDCVSSPDARFDERSSPALGCGSCRAWQTHHQRCCRKILRWYTVYSQHPALLPCHALLCRRARVCVCLLAYACFSLS